MLQSWLGHNNYCLSSPNGPLPSLLRPGWVGPLRQTRRVCTMVSSSSKDHLTRPRQFYDRDKQLSLLRKKLAQAPTALLLVMGPVSSGKTALLKNVLLELRGKGVPVSYVNTRLFNMRNPDGMAEALTNNLWPDALKILMSGADLIQGMGVKVDAGPFDLVRATSKASSMVIGARRSSLTAILEAYQEVIRGTPEAGPYPVLVLDEANTLSSWAPVHQDERAALLQFFVSITKEENTAHVVLATSDWVFADWLAAEIRPEFLEVQVVGNFARDDAKAFFEHELKTRQKLTDANLDEGVWDRVFEVCGGNAGKLRTCAANYDGNWNQALQLTPSVEELRMRDRLSPSPDDGWTKDQLAFIMRTLNASDYGAVDREDLERQLGNGGKAVIASLLKANVLGLRPGFSEWAGDMPVEAWGDRPRRVLITAASATYQYIFRQLVKELPEERPEENPEERPKAGWLHWLLGKWTM